MNILHQLKGLSTRDLWNIAAALMAIAVVSPAISLMILAFNGDSASWLNLFNEALVQAIFNTLLLTSGVGCVVVLLGVGCAWLVTAYDFRGRGTLIWALLLPLAVPAYIVAYAYLDLLHPLGPVQSTLRDWMGVASPREWRLPDIRTLPCAIFLLGCVLYPYVYLSTRAMFLTQPENLLNAARSLGLTPAQTFWRVALPQARPAIVIGLSLALLETINDIGASEFLGVKTITVTLYTTWISKGDIAGAAKIAVLLMACIGCVSLFARQARKKLQYGNQRGAQVMQARQLTGRAAIVACILGWLPVCFGFVLPVGFLFDQSVKRFDPANFLSANLLAATGYSLLIAALVTAFAVTFSIVVAVAARYSTRPLQAQDIAQASAYLSRLGYALPGSVLAIGLLMPYSWLDSLLNMLSAAFANQSPRLWMLGSLCGVVVACIIRFAGISVGNIQAGLTRIPRTLDQVAGSLGHSTFSTLCRVHIPLLKPALTVSAILIFVECIKELPVTLLLRPLGTETLATLLYSDASRGSYEDGGLAALLIVIVSVWPVILLTRIEHTKRAI